MQYLFGLVFGLATFVVAASIAAPALAQSPQEPKNSGNQMQLLSKKYSPLLTCIKIAWSLLPQIADGSNNIQMPDNRPKGPMGG